jgi:hypothetical protein
MTTTITPTSTVSPTVTITPATSTAVYIYAAPDDALPATSVQHNGSVYYLTGTEDMITPGHNIQVEVVIDGISHTANAIAPGNIILAPDGNSVSWQYGEPGGNGGLYIYRFLLYANKFTGNAVLPSPFTVTGVSVFYRRG